MNNSQHHSFDIEIAEKYGIEEAILIHHMQHWIRVNLKNNRNYHDGRTWMYETIEEIASHFPYFTEDQVRNILYKLTHGKSRRSKKKETTFEPVLVKGNYNKTPMDRTVWYAFKDKNLFTKRSNAQIETVKSPNPSGEMTGAIPDTKYIYIKDKKERKKKDPSPPLRSTKRKYLEFVFLEDDEYEELEKRYTKEKLDGMIEDLNDYLGQNGNRDMYKSHLHVLRKWLRKDQKDANSQNVKSADTRQWCIKISSEYQEELKKKGVKFDINQNDVKIEMGYEPQPPCFVYDEKGFRSKIAHELRRRGVFIAT